MILKTFENFVNDNSTFILQLIAANVVKKHVVKSKDFMDKLNSDRLPTMIDHLLQFVTDFNQHIDLDFVDFWNKRKNTYNIPANIKSLKAEDILSKFLTLDKKLRFKNSTVKTFLDVIGVEELPKGDHNFYTRDSSRDGNIVTGQHKNNVDVFIKKIN